MPNITTKPSSATAHAATHGFDQICPELVMIGHVIVAQMALVEWKRRKRRVHPPRDQGPLLYGLRFVPGTGLLEHSLSFNPFFV